MGLSSLELQRLEQKTRPQYSTPPHPATKVLKGKRLPGEEETRSSEDQEEHRCMGPGQPLPLSESSTAIGERCRREKQGEQWEAAKGHMEALPGDSGQAPHQEAKVSLRSSTNCITGWAVLSSSFGL